MPHICSIYAAYKWHILAHISPNSAYFAPKQPAYFKKNFRYKPVSLLSSSEMGSHEELYAIFNLYLLVIIWGLEAPYSLNPFK